MKTNILQIPAFPIHLKVFDSFLIRGIIYYSVNESVNKIRFVLLFIIILCLKNEESR